MTRFLSVAQPGGTLPRPIHGVLLGSSGRRLVVTALPGLRPDGTMPQGLDAQAEQAFANLAMLIEAADMRREDIVAVSAYVAVSGAKALVHRTAAARLGAFGPTTAVRQVVSLSQAGSVIELDAEIVED